MNKIRSVLAAQVLLREKSGA